MMNSLEKFARDTRGNIMMLVALSIIPLIGVAGLAVDFAHADAMRVRLSAAADAAALAGAQLYSGNEAARIARAQETFEAARGQFTSLSSITFSAADVTTAGLRTGFRVQANANSDTLLGKIFGRSYLPLQTSAEATIGDNSKLEIALVLDTTGSMSGSKIVALKTAAANMVNTLKDKELVGNEIRFALVPFAEYVNVGMSNRNRSWIDVPNDSSTTAEACWNTYPNAVSSNCREETVTYNNDGLTVSYQSTVCDWNYGAPVEVCGPTTSTLTWSGCVGSRNYPLNVSDTGYTTSRVPGIMNTSCSQEIQKLTPSRSTIINAINSLGASGMTYIPAGLSWGWAALSPSDPYSETQKDTSPVTVKQFLVLMTDGANTRSPDYPYHWGSDTALANTLTAELCVNIKNDSIRVFTIAFEVTDTTIRNILRNCASSTGDYFDASNATQLDAAFTQIGQMITALRLKK